jgi:hypothetical protein
MVLATSIFQVKDDGRADWVLCGRLFLFEARVILDPSALLHMIILIDKTEF